MKYRVFASHPILSTSALPAEAGYGILAALLTRRERIISAQEELISRSVFRDVLPSIENGISQSQQRLMIFLAVPRQLNR